MPDLLTHVLVGYIVGTITATRVGWRPGVTVVMLGAILPDLTKIKLLVSDATMESLLAIPFSWRALHTLGGVVVTAAVGALLVGDADRRRVFALLLAGAISHLCLDALLFKPSGYSAALWWPILDVGLPTPGLYLSSDRWPALVAGTAALGIYFWDQRIRG